MKTGLTQKEKTLLQDQQGHEKICIQKYNKYASQAQDPQLQQLFSSNAQHEQQHYDTLSQMLSGQVPNITQQSTTQGAQSAQSTQNQQNQLSSSTQTQSAMQSEMGSQSDAELCTDMLMTEKFVSGAYDTAVFEFTDTAMRQALNHIQKEEQEHGEALFQYMQNKGMYNVQ